MLIPASLSSLNSSVIHARQPGYRSGSMASGIYNKGFAWSMISLKRWYARAAWGPSPPPLRKSFMLALPSLFFCDLRFVERRRDPMCTLQRPEHQKRVSVGAVPHFHIMGPASIFSGSHVSDKEIWPFHCPLAPPARPAHNRPDGRILTPEGSGDWQFPDSNSPGGR